MVEFVFMVGFIWAYCLVWGNYAGKFAQSGCGGLIWSAIIIYIYVHPFEPNLTVKSVTGFDHFLVHEYVKDSLFILGFANAFYDFKDRIAVAMEMGIVSALEEMKYRTLELMYAAKSQVLNFVNRHQYRQRIDEQEADLEAEREKREEAEQREQRYKEEARRAREEAKKSKHQHQQKPPPSPDELDPTNLKDAYEILGVPYGTDKAECKKAFRKLMAVYHPDKLAGFSGWRKEQMEKEAKMIGLAWDTILSNKNK